jgi:hypothetical protein
MAAASYIIGAGVSILPMGGGLTGLTPYPDTAEFIDLIKAGQLRYVLIDPRQHPKGGTDTANNVAWTDQPREHHPNRRHRRVGAGPRNPTRPVRRTEGDQGTTD